jgi:hypothetical protein
MKRNLPYLLLIISVPVCLYFGALAQESSGDAASKDAASMEKRESGKTDSSTGKEGAAAIDRSGNTGVKTDDAKKEARKKAERKKKEVKKQAEKKPEKKPEDKKKEIAKKEDQKKEDIPEESIDLESGDSLLLIDHEGIKYNRIPDITIKKEEPGQDLVRIPDDKISGKEKKKPEGGIFGPKTDTIARWGLLVFLFLIFIIYKTRAKKSRKKGSRIITKR